MSDPVVAKIQPGENESQKEFIARCMSAEKTSIPDQSQRLAACFSMYRRKANAAGCPMPGKDESQSDYMDRCSADHPSADCEKAWAAAQGGDATYNAERLFSVFNVAQEIPIREEILDGVKHYVLPMVALVEGTYQCANCSGPNHYPQAEFGKNVGAWNGRPVTIGHPMRDNSYVSAGSPDVWAKERIGTTFHANLDGGKLYIEAWIDPAAVARAGADARAILDTVKAGGQVEVSTAAWIDEVPRVGSHNGKTYSVVQANFQPDHVALLKQGDRGACSWADGCGVRVASANEICCESCANGAPCESGLTPEDKEALATVLAAMQVLIENGFTVTASGAGTETMTTTSQPEETAMAEDQKGAAVPEATPSKTDEQLELPVQPPKAAAAPEPHGLSADQRRIAELEAKVEHLTAQAAARPKASTIEEYLDQAPVALRETLLQAHKAAERRRLELIDKVKQAPGCMYTAEQLDKMQEQELLPLVALIARTDFSVQPPINSRYASDGDDYAELPPSVWAPRSPHKQS